MNKSLTKLTSIAIAMASLLTIGLMGRSSVTATQNIVLPKANIYGLTTDNTFYVLTPGATSFTKFGRINPNQIGGQNLIGIDFRVADGQLYAAGDKGGLFTINLAGGPSASQVSTMSPRFGGGVQSLMDFNPVANALRLISSGDLNYAVVNSNGGNLNTTAIQTKLAYATGDVNFGVDPNIIGGAYSNNYVGAPNTIFYMIDFDLDTFVTIAGLTATGSSNTGGGQLQTIGPIVDGSGQSVNFSSVADLDIYTDKNRVNTLVAMTGRKIFTIDLNQINQNQQVGQTQNVVAKGITLSPFTATNDADAFIDIAIAPPAVMATPPPTPASTPAPATTPTPTPTPTPAPAPNPTATPTPTQAPVNGARCTVNYKVTGQWDNGFNAIVNLKNHTGRDLNGWQFTFNFAGNQTISSLYNGKVLQSGKSVKVGNANFNKLFANASTVQFGFTAAYSGSNPT